MNTYEALYRGKRETVEALTSYAAQLAAASLFKAKKPHEVTVIIVARNGVAVTHATTDFG